MANFNLTVSNTQSSYTKTMGLHSVQQDSYDGLKWRSLQFIYTIVINDFLVPYVRIYFRVKYVFGPSSFSEIWN